eukprot:jgi/Orpsp1_1/1175187/evm.model.c7180000052940.1
MRYKQNKEFFYSSILLTIVVTTLWIIHIIFVGLLTVVQGINFTNVNNLTNKKITSSKTITHLNGYNESIIEKGNQEGFFKDEKFVISNVFYHLT